MTDCGNEMLRYAEWLRSGSGAPYEFERIVMIEGEARAERVKARRAAFRVINGGKGNE